uniref:MalT-like TPR region domain-containing protein n=2 Tax=Physcomitrium patens TaxID=3218 RepID=A0A7I4BAZ2_PHYPA
MTSLSFQVVGSRKVNIQRNQVMAESGRAIQIPSFCGHQGCSSSGFPSSSLQFSNHCYEKRSSTSKWSFVKRSSEPRQPPSCVITVLLEGFSCKRNSPWLPSVVIGAVGKSSSVGYTKVDVDDDEDETGDRVLQEQFNRFAIAMALQDTKMTQKIIQKMGDPKSIGDIPGPANEVTELQEQLQELYGQALKLIDEGDEETARELIEANYEVVVDQLESGYKNMEQVAMLDISAQLRLSLGEFEETKHLLYQIKDLMEVVGINSKQSFVDKILKHVRSMYTAIGQPADGLPFYLKRVEIQEYLLGEESPLIVRTLLGLASTLTKMDNTIRAVEVYERVLMVIEKNRGSTDNSLALPLSHLGHSLLEEGRVDELVEQTYGAHNGRVGIAKCALARAKAARSAIVESISICREGLHVMEECSKFMDDDPSLETVRTDLAEHDEADELWEINLHAKEQDSSPNDPTLVVHLQNLATFYAVSGKYEKYSILFSIKRFEEALMLMKRVLSIQETQVGPDMLLHKLGIIDEIESLYWS